MTTSPGRDSVAAFFAPRFLRAFPSSIEVVSISCTARPLSSELAPAASCSDTLSAAIEASPLGSRELPASENPGSPRTWRAAAASSASTSVSVTSARPIGGFFAVPLKMQSAIRSARRDLWLCSPRTQEIASTMLDFPQPLGPIMQLNPVPLKVRCVFSQNDLNPTNSTLRSLSKVTPL